MRFSIVTICLNPGRFLEEAITSALQQDFEDFEYLLIDGGSTDGTLETIRQFAADDQRIRWSSTSDSGIADAMNRGVQSSRGEVISFLHADDRYPEPNVLSLVNRRFQAEPLALWATGRLREIDASSQTVREIPVRSFSYRRLLRNNIIYHPATFVRREAFAQAGCFDPGLQYTMDYDLWLRLGRLSAPIEIDQVLAEFRVHQGSLSSSNRLVALDEEYLVRCRYTHGWLGPLGHALYHAWRRRRC